MVINKKSATITAATLHTIFILMCIAFVVPFILVISISFSNEKDIMAYGYSFLPRNFDLAAYKYIFDNPKSIINAYKVTIFTTVVSTILSVLLISCIAYPLSKKDFIGKRFISFYIYFTMIFSGGMVSSYILITQYLRMNNTVWVFIFPSLVNAYNVFLLRTFFAKLPESIVESALLDGASEFKILFRIILPLSKPALATIALFVCLAHWNDWFTAMLFIEDDKLLTLQYLLQRIMMNIQLLQQHGQSMQTVRMSEVIPSETVRMAMAVIAAGPMLVVFPFFQKYFVQGLTIGSVKG